MNAGVFAFAAAVVGFSIAKYRVEQDRISELSSIRVLLPNALNKLSDYCGELKVFVENSFHHLSDERGDFVCQEPVFPSDVYDVFSRAMRCSLGDVRDRLAEILELQQIVSSRVSGLGSSVRGNSETRYTQINKYDLYYKISELKCMTDSLFSFSRREMEAVDDSISIKNSFGIYKFDLDSGFMDYVHKRKIR